MGKKFSSVEERRAYNRLHYRVNRVRGRAILQPCVTDCGARAREWAQLHGTDGSDPQHYQPMCHRCHQKYDDKWNDEERARVSASTKKIWEDSPERRMEMSARMSRPRR